MKYYEGTVYWGCVGSEIEYTACRDSIERIRFRQGDEGGGFIRATKGFEARQMHLNNFIATEHDFLFLMDADQLFPPDILERLRSHRMPYITGLCPRRQIDPVAPLWYEYLDVPWPVRPWLHVPEKGKLHKLSGAGWGCMLIHRDVILAVRKLLKGEGDIIEDDMDIFPYDLSKILRALDGIERVLQSGTMDIAAIQESYQALRTEIRPLRVVKDNVGSDLRYPFYARLAGFTLMGDPDAECSHMVNYELSPNDHRNVIEVMGEENSKKLYDNGKQKWMEEIGRLDAARKAL